MQADSLPRNASRLAKNIPLLLLLCCYGVLWVGGVTQSWRETGSAPIWTAPVFLIVSALIVLVASCSNGEMWWLLLISLIGFAAEALGVHFGVPFGSYSYTDALGTKLFDVPLVMTCAWMTLTVYVKQLTSGLRLRRTTEIVIAAFWLTAIDLLIDPLAANQLGYWRWHSIGSYYGVPWPNFAGWLFTSLVLFAVLRKPFKPNHMTRLVGSSIVLFFTLLALSFDNRTVALIGCALLVADMLVLFLCGETDVSVSAT